MTNEERQRHIDRLRLLRSDNILSMESLCADTLREDVSIDAITAAIAALQREGEMEALFAAAQTLCVFCAANEYPVFPSSAYTDMTNLIDQLATMVRKVEALNGR